MFFWVILVVILYLMDLLKSLDFGVLEVIDLLKFLFVCVFLRFVSLLACFFSLWKVFFRFCWRILFLWRVCYNEEMNILR